MTQADPLTIDLDDSDDARAGYDWAHLDLSRLKRPNSIRRLIGIVIALMVVFWPARSALVAGRLVGIGLVGYSVVTLWSVRKARPVPWLAVVLSVGALGLGAFMTAFPSQTEVALGRILGVSILVAGVIKLGEAPRHRGQSDFRWTVASASSLIAIGILVALFASELLSALIFAGAAAWVLVEVLAISVLLDPNRAADAPRTPTAELIAEWFADRPQAVDDRQKLYGELLYEGELAQTKVVRFVALMVFASVIASMGVVADSTAVVVGAMFIAPLMTPLMGMALSLAMGWPNCLARSALVALVGTLLAIGIGFVIGLADFTIVDTLANSQIVS